MPLHACFCSALPFRRAVATSTAKCTRQPSRVVVHACAEERTEQQPSSSSPSTNLTASKRASLVNSNDTPAIFNGPEAVLAVLLAAAALLADFVRNVARLSTTGIHTLDVRAAERSVAELREALNISREVLEETESRFNAVSEQRADVQNALVDADRLRDKMHSATLYAQSAEKQLRRVQNALNNVQQKRFDVAQEKERVDEERQRVETQIAEKRLLVHKLSEQIESAKQKEREIIKQVKYQQQLLDRQLEHTRNKLSEDVSDAEKEQIETKGGDSSRSEMSLKEIKRNLRAEKMALSAEIREARVASDALSDKIVDNLQLLKREMKAKQAGMRARLSKAQNTVDREEKEIQRREGAIDTILDSVENDDDESLLMERAAAMDNTNTVKKRVRKGRKKEVVDKEASTDGGSETTADKEKARKSDAKEEAIEHTLDGSKSEDDSVKAESTSSTKEVKKRTRTRKQAGSADSGSVSTASKTRKRKATRKKRSDKNEDEPLTAQEAMDVRKAMVDLLGDGADVSDLAQDGKSAVAGIVGERQEEQSAEDARSDDETAQDTKRATRPRRTRRASSTDSSA